MDIRKDFEMFSHDRVRASLLAVGWVFSLAAMTATHAAGQSGELFAEPFVVEHYLVQVDERGERYQAPSVVDTYGGSWIVSQRVDDSRLVVDLARAELTEIRPTDGTYWTLGFNRLKQLMTRVAELTGNQPENPELHAKAKADREAPAGPESFTISEKPVTAAHSAQVSTKAATLITGDGIRHLEVRRRADQAAQAGTAKAAAEPAVAELWVDPKVRLKASARSALARFERDALGTEGVMEAAREFVDGAFPIRTVRAESKSDGSRGRIEDVVVRLEKIEAMDRALIRVPEGLRRVPHPLEGLLAFLEREDQRQKMMSGDAASTDGKGDGYGGGKS